jgi:hypothetical protein
MSVIIATKYKDHCFGEDGTPPALNCALASSSALANGDASKNTTMEYMLLMTLPALLMYGHLKKS